MAASLSALRRPDLAAPLHLELWASGHEVEAWRDPEEWEHAGPRTDGARFARDWAHDRAASTGRRERDGWWPHPPDGALLHRMERFGLHRYQRLCRIRGREIEVELSDLEDEAIQQEWQFL